MVFGGGKDKKFLVTIEHRKHAKLQGTVRYKYGIATL